MAETKKVAFIYPGAIASCIRHSINAAQAGAECDQHQSNGLYGTHQLRVRLPGDSIVYRVLICPANAPISIGTVAADEHFLEPIT